MELWKLYRQETTAPATSIIVMAMLSGVANATLLAIINSAVKTASYENLNFRFFLLFVIALTLYLFGKRFALSKTTILIESIISRVRVRISDKIRNSELLFLEKMGKTDVHNMITQDTNLISQSAVIIINACQSFVMLVFCVIYIAIISKLAFVFTVVVVMAGASVYLARRQVTLMYLHSTNKKENKLFGMLVSVLEGFKELKINQKKNDDYFTYVKKVAQETEELKTKTGLRFVIGMMFSDICFYILIALMLFILPRLGTSYSENLIRLTMAVFFIMAPVDIIVSAIPIFSRANVAVGNLYNFEAQLDKASHGVPKTDQVPYLDFAQEIVFEGVTFWYADKEGNPLFTVGPIDLKIKKGELVFLVGGNGSGKSTLLKLMTGLYYPVSGAIRINGQYINKANYQTYREYFSTIFSDFHLFDRLYGLDVFDEKRINELLARYELNKKTYYKEGEFSNLNLSTGQRKRLAMIVALLDDKPIYVFDEWAADQDPSFRKYFYEELLLDLKAQGKTIIAVSHDDRYFQVADRVLKMDQGKIIDNNKSS